MRKFSMSCFIAVALIAAASQAWAQPALTIYNQNFGVVRQTVPLDLKGDLNRVQLSDITAFLEPDSVILRDPTGRRELRIVEQNYRSDPVSQEMLLFLFEGKTIDFLVQRGEQREIVPGKIIRSGYIPPPPGSRRSGSGYYTPQGNYYSGSGQPIIEVEGRLRFQLPGVPLFPSLGDDTILKPTLHWVLQTDKAGPLNAELAYVTGGMSWEADYNVVAPEQGDILDLVGWVTMDNQSGKTFENAKIKLMAGDVSKIQPGQENTVRLRHFVSEARDALPPAVTEKAFDEYHLYTLQRPATLRDRETKQVEFVRADGIKSQRVYVYDGIKIDLNRYGGYSYENIRQEREYGTQSNPKVSVMREFKNSAANGLGIPLPKGRVRFYRRDTGGQLEFTGENIIDHTPKDETLRVYTGDAFDLVGERKRTAYKIDTSKNFIDESFEIKLRNHKKEAVETRVVEHLYRGTNWEITAKSDAFLKTDAQTIEFRIQLKPDEEKTVSYTVHYTW